MRLIGRLLALSLLLLLLAYAVFFALDNTQPVQPSLVFWQLPSLSLGMWLIMAFAVGGLSGLLLGSVAGLRHKGRHWQLQRQLRQQQRKTETAD